MNPGKVGLFSESRGWWHLLRAEHNKSERESQSLQRLSGIAIANRITQLFFFLHYSIFLIKA